MKRARVAWAGAVHDAVACEGQLELLTPAVRGQRVPFEGVVWLPPLPPQPAQRPRTILALGLNYADHAKELAFKAPEEPLAFVKGEASLIGHRAFTVRPPEVQFMHYECELAVVIGRTAKRVKKADVPDPMNLALSTTVNGTITQQGHTRDMIFDVPTLIEYFSAFMTLQPGDLILTGTPDGVVDCKPGDVVVTSIEGLGSLENTIAV
jgi:5-oxopent-3-ene-1,2,5-tricarboxylate decarboxylase/2-hydroxyhepta-2,4-diene-1,7-dioate isomerase